MQNQQAPPNYSEDQRAFDEEIARKQQARAALPPELQEELAAAYEDWHRFLTNDPGVQAERAQAAAARERGEPVHFDIRARAEQLRRRAFAQHGIIYRVANTVSRTVPRPRGAGRPAARRAAGPRSGQDPGDSDPDEPPSPPRRARPLELRRDFLDWLHERRLTLARRAG